MSKVECLKVKGGKATKSVSHEFGNSFLTQTVFR